MKLTYKVLLLAILCLSFKIYAGSSYNSFRVQCESLVGTGYVMVWFADQTFKIPVDCQPPKALQ
jgi:hypothetical protein